MTMTNLKTCEYYYFATSAQLGAKFLVKEVKTFTNCCKKFGMTNGYNKNDIVSLLKPRLTHRPWRKRKQIRRRFFRGLQLREDQVRDDLVPVESGMAGKTKSVNAKKNCSKVIISLNACNNVGLEMVKSNNLEFVVL